MIAILQGDLTTLEVDAIVNAANERMRGGGGLDGAIHAAAGPGLLRELQQFPGCPTGQAVLSGGHALPARFIIHAVGPRWSGGKREEPRLLRSAYDSVFAIAREAGVRTIAFPAISTGIFGYPKRPAAQIALASFIDQEAHFDRIIACLFDAESRTIYEDELVRLGREPGDAL